MQASSTFGVGEALNLGKTITGSGHVVVDRKGDIFKSQKILIKKHLWSYLICSIKTLETQMNLVKKPLTTAFYFVLT